MKIKSIYFREHIFFFILVLAIITVSALSYYRFMVKHDYVVGYQGVCDPAIGGCFKSCEDDACTKVDYYSNMLKYEPDLYMECGKDITDCDAASTCLVNDHKCSVTYCNPEVSDNTCESPTDKSIAQKINSQNQTDSTKQKSLQNNTSNNKI